jgi:uncharacterized protein YuzE
MSISQETLGEYNYDPEVNAAYVKLSDERVAKTSTFGCILIDRDEGNGIVGVELLDADLETLPVDMITETLHLDDIARAQLERVSDIIENHAHEDEDY